MKVNYYCLKNYRYEWPVQNNPVGAKFYNKQKISFPMATIKEALKFPFTNTKRLFNIWWILVPIWGWCVVAGYAIRTINEILAGRNQELPAIRPFTGLFKTGFLAIVVVIILEILVFVVLEIPYVGWLFYVYLILVSAALYLQFAVTQSIKDGLNFKQAHQTIFGNFSVFLSYFLKAVIVTLIWLAASIPVVTIIVTLPALAVSSYYLWAEFYKEVRPHPVAQVTK
jgi:hypothetical protein